MNFKNTILTVVILIGINIIEGSHFRGGIISWKYRDNKVDITYKLTYTGSPCGDSLDPGEGSINCHTGCVGTLISPLSYYCTDSSVDENWKMGQKTMPVTLNSSTDNIYRFGYSGCCLVSLVEGGSSWSVMATANLTVRSDTGLINSPPSFAMQPVVRLKQSCSYSIKIPVIDEDGDFVKCRWATDSSGVNECGDACSGLSNSKLDEENCTVTYNAIGATGWYVVALQIEDFATRQYTNPLSSLPLQFMVYIYSFSTSCDSKPVIETNVADGIKQNNDERIAAINTVSPLGMTKSELLTYGTSNNKSYMDVTWIPTETQVGSHIFCYTAFDDNREASNQECIKLIVLNDCSSNPCVNGGSCNDEINGYKCTCAAGFTGTRCEIDIDECVSNPCENGATCNDQVNGYNCTCADGFTDTHCQIDIDECSSNPCQNGATCNDQVNEYNCSCVVGFINTHCETDIDNCASNPCQYGTCNDRVDSFHCDCGIFLTGKTCNTLSSLSIAFLALASAAVLVTFCWFCCFRRVFGMCKRDNGKKKVKPLKINVKPKLLDLAWI
ncbi:Delta-like protein B,Fibropellin-1,Fibropellin-3,Neurogenic locus protein delta,Protein crumbs homolog 1,Sushi, nidogen and EGF-like domain-containing protein 1,Protein jagged-1,Protein eyes shut,Delta-like protein 1,Protein jagged-1a,Neurogenic locus notch homolog protein 2,Protein crumbs,Neurogenic locus notch homolog protein 4,Sushi, von Willebrand factor type A, EGF and pentraxin domain-containing protein 1,Protein crumbs homolog 2,Neurogenic locus Notch protein,Neurogenic locus notch homolog protein 1|uniref:EGF-like domain-containing protein n=1 Tax=Mytilus edulis TaxID=6550 RepID=A0A8S3QXY1_MYTED|nr:Delta-like protein B,Fibropellin-1,Fibropellin-3,Neurogenic locus protein delta,Protein crumbs homolog 1,Sushi, nidogen and EGF-like domain-containing protein 1,Protein jagged-1,Protein eyes shut,Delta-like protein 1,Protein jagged-1a,Neurogenic locus notch homolog protein 2,Protein crumbs,Neurogenic locus notch homolog protein 4,Sushi, von Willebrand factor type A, EGF and pentraxin domain-containing protein 1,Protein crumbs homolog 2,Neurogenic locus Notch protein,Neurogenic locus notch homolo